MSRIAFIEDHIRLAGLVRRALSEAGIEADHFCNVSEARYGLSRGDYAVLVIDRGLPDGDGLALLRELRADGNTTPCLMLTARDALHDRIEGLENGADDYVTKPFAMSELVARVRTLMRRTSSFADLVLAFADIKVNPKQRSMRCSTEAVQLAPAELQVILCLIKARGQVVRHSALEHAGWGLGEAVTPNALEVTMHRLRKKLAAIGSATRVMNVRGAGFLLESMNGREL
ncbi:response regulator transcription factor [Paraburkholderia dipogonis]|uniref:Response regulator transcription factor n=1 Tax=Paraburkholderia dipogonis TaxID=1211383 RepID=A0A4Y8MWZ5_9BURK|nr:response regulator transcription factor [Paraburkholderia dipogonis]TFE41922.1 response regulator transcription factor [Paraburkholderia dipogonis]